MRSGPAAGGVLLLALGLFACGEDRRPAGAVPETAGRSPTEIAHFRLSAEAVPSDADAAFDAEVSQDGDGSLRVMTGEEGGRMRLYRLDDVGPIQGTLLYTGFLRSRDLQGAAFLELWCHPTAGDAAFVRGVSSRVEGSSDWKPQELPFRPPESCRNPVSVELNVVIQGAGTVWIDNLRLWDLPVE